MCGRSAGTLPPELIARLFGTRNMLPNIGSNWNTAPTQDAPVARRHLDGLKWGLLPSWTKGAAKVKRPANARAECVSAWKKDPVGGVIGVQKGPL